MIPQKNKKSESGQFLVLLAILLVGLLAILALVLDGGHIYFRERATQNAADAGALAGARELCITQDEGQASFMAHQYAEVHNGPTVADVEVEGDEVTVIARQTFDTYFAHIIGIPEVTVEATAAAGCYNPSEGSPALPVAWACRPPIEGGGSTSEDCQEQAITQEQLDYYINHPPPNGEIYPELYIVMDSKSEPDDLDDICTSQGGWLECDLDGDGDDDLVANGDRSWLDLNGGGGGASELSNWIDNGFPGTIEVHTWLGGQSGVETSVFQTVADHVGEIAALPVFDAFCDDYPDPRCADAIHANDTLVTSAGGNYYYHVISFAGFYISCVNAGGVPGPECPGHKVARELGVIKANTKTIEGYFVIGVISGIGGGGSGSGTETGAYTVKLIH